MKTTISTTATTYTYGLEGLHEYLWDGKLTREEIEEKADAIMSKVVDLINADGFTWDTTHGVLEYEDDDYETSDDALEEFLDDKERFIRQVVKEMESSDSREMELADFCREMISLGWTMDTFDSDFDGFESDEVSKDEKETCRRVFGYVWEQVQEEMK